MKNGTAYKVAFNHITNLAKLWIPDKWFNRLLNIPFFGTVFSSHEIMNHVMNIIFVIK